MYSDRYQMDPQLLLIAEFFWEESPTSWRNSETYSLGALDAGDGIHCHGLFYLW